MPSFIAEILSPSTGRGDRKVKRPAYQRAGVGEYWIVERWQPADARPEICLVRAVWQPRPDLEPFELDLAEYFAEIWGDGPN
ncbi:MAG: Uma2 family endonuclease [Gemmatimonadetes bacterium]|nr:Uma2 family endonuclease [Gemmatimonadota bacterium]